MPRSGSIEIKDMLRFLADIHHSGNELLDAVGQIVLRDSRQGLGSANLFMVKLIEIAKSIGRLASGFPIHPFRVGKIKNGIASVGPALHPLAKSRKKARAPK